MGNYPATNVKNRRYKTCVSCGIVGYGVALFPYYKYGKCRECWQGRVTDRWDKWAKVDCSTFFRDVRKRENRNADEWNKWALKKQCVLITRKRVEPSPVMVTNLVINNWDDCFKRQMENLNKQATHQEMDLWDRKAYSWMRSLLVRDRTRKAQQSDAS